MGIKKISSNNFFWKVFEFFRNVFIKFHKDRCLIRSSGLAYSSLLALVPLSAIVFSLLSAFGVLANFKETIQYHILEQLMPVRQDEIISYVDRFVDNTRALGIAGLTLFVFTSVFLMSNIQKNFNDIWKVNRKRSFISQFSTYTSVIVMGTLLVGTGFALTGWIGKYLKSLPANSITYFLDFLFSLLPAMTFFFSILLVITAVPSVRVKLKSAAAGALTGYICIWVLKVVFVNFSNAAIRYSIIYGSIALVPIFLLWLYMLWAIILFSAEVTFVHQARWTIDYYSDAKISLYDEFILRLETYMYIAETNLDGVKIPGPEDISEDFRMSVSKAESVLQSLEKGGIIYKVMQGKKQGYVPSKNIVSVSLKEAAAGISGYKKKFGKPAAAEEDVPGMIESMLEKCGNITVYQMIKNRNDKQERV